MKKILISVLLLFLITVSNAQEDNNKKILRRADSFFGLHFDFHATNADSAIGKTFTYEMADSMLALVKPDFIQVDCKGHPGISSYPTKVGNPAPGFVKDPYKIWREVTNKNGVALFVHYSGVIDNEAVKKHPDWAALDDSGKIMTGKTSVRGPYVDRLLIPQMKELIDNYHINGAWVDGECWALELDYSNYMLDAFHKETGIKNVPRSDEDAGWNEFRNFNRNSLRKYIAHYVDALHKYDPDFQITSNWAFSSLMPEPVDANIDFISGDFTPDNSVYSGLYEARCIAPQGKPWDLMAWSFTNDGETGVQITKSPVQLMQAASAVISMGGGFQLYFQQNRDASLRPWNFKLMKEVADFCRARQPFCKGAVPVPQIALLYSSANYHLYSNHLYQNSTRVNNPVKGMLNMLLDGQNAVEILMEHNLKDRINEYPVVIVPECKYLTNEFKSVLLEYVNNGGNLLVVGPDAVKMFSDQLNVKMPDSVARSTKNIAWNGRMAGINSLFQPFIPGKSVETVGALYNAADFRFPSTPAASISSYGKGKIAGVYFNIGREYMRLTNPVYRDFINAIVRKLFPDPKVTVSGSEDVAVTINKLENKLAVNLINMSGPHANTSISRYDSIPQIGPLTIKVKLDKAPEKVMLQPENIPLKYSYSNGEMVTEVEHLDVHSIIVIE
ncbi:MAG: hypothetical protein P4L45_13430 [Ignavibacteriaceae bacterium]|nr:hypothetical protein [Ignavibacteriaceae bacterium]